MNDQETPMTTTESVNTSAEAPPEAVQTEKPAKKRSATPWVVTAVVCLAVGLLIHSGIHSRVEAEAVLTRSTQEAATPTVAVVYPKLGSPAEEIALPGNTQAFTD